METNMRELCRAIEMPEEVTECVTGIDAELRYETMEAAMTKLFDPKTWDAGLDELKKSLGEDVKGFKMLSSMLHCCWRSWEFYEAHGISGQIFVETMKCFSRFVREHKESYGVYGFDREFWTARQLSGRLFRIGELEYEMKEESGEPVVALHIPSDALLEREKVLASIRQAREWLKEKFPEYGNVKIQCHSWLLSPTLKEVLSQGSNILAFQELFDIETLGEDKEGEFKVWVFKRSDLPLADLPENTSLQRRLKSYLLSGGKMLEAGGCLKPMAGDCVMSDKEMMQKNVEEFARLQSYMLACEKDSNAYKLMKERYIELKVILSASGINITELDRIKE